MARYDSLRKLERNKLLKQYARDHPDLSLTEIGNVFGVSASRVSRILRDNKKGQEV